MGRKTVVGHLRRLPSWPVITAALWLSGCSATNSIGTAGTPFEWAAAKQIHVGTTEEEMIGLIGRPRMVKSMANGDEVWIWVYANGFTGQSGNVSFSVRDRKVIAVPNMEQFG
jgi:outer membrane protein assembly factor BamE (lipoprotein component of BamABCDE complex)